MSSMFAEPRCVQGKWHAGAGTALTMWENRVSVRAYVHAIRHVFQREGLGRVACTRSSTANSFIGHLDHFSKQLEPLLTRRPQDDGTLHVARRVRNRSRLIRRLMHRRTREAASEHAYSFADRYGYLRRLVSPRAQQLPRARAHRARTKSSRFRPLRFVFPRPRFLAAKTCRAPAITHEDRRAEPFSATRDGAHALRAITH